MTQTDHAPETHALKPAAWVVLGLTGLLLAASLLGQGTGLFGSSSLRSLAWTWVLLSALAGMMAALLWVFLRPSGGRPGQ